MTPRRSSRERARLPCAALRRCAQASPRLRDGFRGAAARAAVDAQVRALLPSQNRRTEFQIASRKLHDTTSAC
jgi:hypothetical protein